MLVDNLIYPTLTFISGALIGCLTYALIQKIRLTHYKQLAADILKKAELEGDALKKTAELANRQQQIDQQREFENRWQQERRKIQIEDERLKQREDKLETRMNLVEKKLSDLEKRELLLINRKAQVEEEKKVVEETQTNLIMRLERAAGLSTKEAKEILFNEITHEVQKDAANFIRKTTIKKLLK